MPGTIRDKIVRINQVTRGWINYYALGSMKTAAQLLIGFAAESENLLENAQGKLARKNLDWIVANKLSDGFAKSTNICTVLGKNGEKLPFEELPKTELAVKLLETFGL
jgi:phosphopantothenoylcysteine decarboxylase/phosphopantothenate--cysteine ligase